MVSRDIDFDLTSPHGCAAFFSGWILPNGRSAHPWSVL